MAKAVKKKEKSWFNKQDVVAVLLGLGLIWIGGLLLSLNWRYLLPLNDLNSTQISMLNLIVALVAGLSYVFSGWLVVKKAKNKAWYIVALPAFISVIVALMFMFIASPEDGTIPPLSFLGASAFSLTAFDDTYIGTPFILPLLLSLLGGYAAKRFKAK